ncbi:hypothetical protein EDD36DRAFT_428961 [Exophiala viscosa]|uniref:Uncharacterized protein n=1 Tax=Exophiala viscosa TaxID=2486360 RepID=A0AAN6E1T0_9EURO|nr:hypothetical protein EDD36DRAFT_428961 [Exophiala viscosa]
MCGTFRFALQLFLPAGRLLDLDTVYPACPPYTVACLSGSSTKPSAQISAGLPGTMVEDICFDSYSSQYPRTFNGLWMKLQMTASSVISASSIAKDSCSQSLRQPKT